MPGILIIDDNPNDVLIITNILKSIDTSSLYTADTLRCAVEKYQNNKIDLIFLDLYLPDSRGIDTLIKLQSSFKATPIIILSDIDDNEIAVKSLNFGAQDYVEKQNISKANILRIIKYSIERNKNMREIEEINERLVSLNAKKNEFLSIASHDIRTPLSTIYTLSEMLTTHVETEELSLEKLKRSLQMITNSSRKILEIVNYFLDISKIESENIELTYNKTDYLVLIQNIIKELSGIANNKSISITLNSPLANCICNIDSGKIEQVITNLISNAIKYSNENTKVSVEIYCKDSYVITKVIDNGIGIEESKISDIFTPYKKAGAPTGGEKSTGLGLAIAKKIVQAHGGEIGVSSILQKGSTFYFSVPMDLKNSP